MPEGETPKWLSDWIELQASLEGEGVIPTDDANEKEPRTDKENEPRERSEDQRIANALAAINRTLIDQGDAGRSEERREDTGNKWLQGLTLAFVIATTIGIFWQGSIFNKQLIEMRSAGEQTKQLIETNAKLAEIASQQAGAAVKQAEATDKEASAMGQNAQVAHDNMIAAQRAWVGPQNASIDGAIAVEKPLTVIVTYLNTGREPGIDLAPRMDGFIETQTEDQNGTSFARMNQYFLGCRSAVSQQAGQVVFPTTGFSTYQFSTQLSGADVDQDFIDGKKTLIVEGCFAYKSFNIVRHSYFCYYFVNNKTKPSNLSICNIGHYAD